MTTPNPVPSGDAEDRFKNTQTLDELINSSLLVSRSRLGIDLETWAGIRQRVTNYLIAQGYESVYLVYGPGVVVQRQTQLVQRNGELYRVLNAADLPLTLTGTWATDAPKLQAVGDQALRPIVEDYRSAMGRSDFMARFAQAGTASNNVLIIGDSNWAGAGSSGGYPTGVGGRLARALMNHFDKQPGTDRGYLYFAWLNAYQQLLSEGGWNAGGGGSAVAGGPGGNAWRLPAGAWAEKTGIEVRQAKVFYAPSTDGSTMQITVNGALAGSPFTVDSTGISPSFNLAAVGYIKPTDVVRFTCVTGSIDVYGFRLLRAGGSRGPLLYCSPEGSQSFSDYSGSRADLLASYLNDDLPNVPTLIMVGLGTNNMITAAGKQKTPAAMAADMQAFITKWRTLIPGCIIEFGVPPRPGPSVTLPYGPYEDYVKAMRTVVAGQTDMGLVRTDLSGIEGSQFYASPDPVPDVHWNDYGHAAAAKYWCDYLGIAADTAAPKFAAAADSGSNANGSYDINSAGRLTCSRYFADLAVSIADGATYTSPVYPFPKAFSSAPVKFYGGYVTNAGGAALSLSVTASASGNTGWQFLIKNTSGVAVTRVLDLSFFAYGTPA